VTAWTQRATTEVVSRQLSDLFAAAPEFSAETSLVLHDLDLMRRRVAELVDAFPPATLHAVAIKANPLVALLRELVASGTGLEAASIEEVHLALAAGCRPDRIVFDSPAKTDHEIRFALDTGLTLNVDNLDELARLVGHLPAHPSARVGVRVNPEIADGAIAATSVGGRSSRFGLPIDAVLDHVVPVMAEHPIVQGLHVHVGSQGCSVDLLAAAARVAGDLRREVDALLDRRAITFVDLGGGLPTDYDEEATAPSVQDYADRLRSDAPDLMDGSVDLITEFGRALHAGCASAVSRVEYVKQVAGDDVAVIHLGADFVMRTAYVPDVWRHRFGVVDRDGAVRDGPQGPWTVAGPLCFAGDVIGRGVTLPPVRTGDRIVIHDVGAYTLSMWSRHCSRGLPAVIGLTSTGWQLLRAAERPEDVVAFWS